MTEYIWLVETDTMKAVVTAVHHTGAKLTAKLGEYTDCTVTKLGVVTESVAQGRILSVQSFEQNIDVQEIAKGLIDMADELQEVPSKVWELDGD